MKIGKLNGEHFKSIICILILFSLTLVVFSYSVEIREPWYGELSQDNHQWLTGSTILFSKNWYQEGPSKLGFAMLCNPASIEFTNLSSRDPYMSYLPGCLIPIYIMGVLTGTEPNVSMVMSYNLCNHFCIAFLLSIMIFVFLRQIKIDYLNSILFAIIPIFLELLLPGPLYWHQNVFFADQAVILPFVLYIFLEVIQDGLKGKYEKVLCILQNIILFYGIFTDWLFVFIALTVYLKRIIEEKIKFNRNIKLFFKESFKFWLIPVLAFIFYITQILFFNQLQDIINIFFLRSGFSEKGSQYIMMGPSILRDHIVFGYGEIGAYALCFTFVIVAALLWFISFEKILKNDVDLKIKRIGTLMAILLIPCMLQVLIFRNHSIVHNFSVLKFAVSLATIPFVLGPISIYLILKSRIKIPDIRLGLSKKSKIDFNLLLIFLVVFAAVSFYLVDEHLDYTYRFPKNNHNYSVLGDSIQRNTQYSDIVFSPDFEISEIPPQQLSYSMKRVYKINSIGDIGGYTKGISGYHIVVMFIDHPSQKWQEQLVNFTLVQDGDYYYYRLN